MIRLTLLGFLIRAVILVVLLWVIAAIIYRAFQYLRGRRNRERGIPCIQCKRKAFPVEGTTNHYRCGICGCRFEGSKHF
jgi:hypothetical protein